MVKPSIADQQKQGRASRINALMASIQACSDAGKVADEEKLIAEFCLKWGSARRTVMEYIKTLADAEKIVIFDGEILIKKSPKEDMQKLEDEIKEVLGNVES